MKLPNFLSELSAVKYDLPDPEYRAAHGVSNSMLKAIALDGEEPGSPAHFVAQFEKPKEDTDAMFIGRSVHSRILTPDAPLEGMIQIPDEYAVTADSSLVKTKKVAAGDMVKWSGNAKFCKEWKAKQEAAGNRPMTAEEMRTMDGIVNAIAADETCQAIFKDGDAEVSLFKPYYRNGGMVLRKARLDWVTPVPVMVDIKSCQDARSSMFDRTLWQRRYYVQAALYLDLWNELNPKDQKERFCFIAVEKFPPYALQVFDVDPQTLEYGRKEYQRNLALLIECIKVNEWPAYPKGFQPLKMRAPYNMLLD